MDNNVIGKIGEIINVVCVYDQHYIELFWMYASKGLRQYIHINMNESDSGVHVRFSI